MVTAFLGPRKFSQTLSFKAEQQSLLSVNRASSSKRLLLQEGPPLLGKEVKHAGTGPCSWDEEGLYVDWDGQRRWAPTGRIVRDVFPDNYSEGKEHRLSESGLSVLLPGRVQADEHVGDHCAGPFFHMPKDAKTDGAASPIDWITDLIITNLKSKTPRATGMVRFTYVRPCLQLFVPDRDYAQTHHVSRVLVGVMFSGMLQDPASAGGKEGHNDNEGCVLLKCGDARQGKAANLMLTYVAHGPNITPKSWKGFDMKQVSKYIENTWLAQAHTTPERWKVLYVRTSGTIEARLRPALTARTSRDSGNGGNVDREDEEEEAELVNSASKNRDSLFKLSLVDQNIMKPAKGVLQIRVEKGELHDEFLKDLGGIHHGVPNVVFELFEKKHLLVACDFSLADERKLFVWALRECAKVFVDEGLSLFFMWLVNTVLATKDLCYNWALKCSNRRDMVDRTYLCVGVIAGEVIKQWSHLTQAHRKFLGEDAAPKLAKTTEWISVELHEVTDIFDSVRGRYILISRAMQNAEVELSLFFLRLTPLDILCSPPWRFSGMPLKVSYFNLYPPFVQHGDHEAAEELVEYIATAYLRLGKDPSDSFRVFMESTECPGSVRCSGRNKRDFFISFLSACRDKENQIKRQREREVKESEVRRDSSMKSKDSKRSFKPVTSGAGNESLEGTPLPVLPQVDLTFLDVVLGDYAERRAVGLTTADVDDLREMLEAVLLTSAGDNLFEWAKRLHMDRVEIARAFLDEIGAKYIAETLRAAVRGNRVYRYDDENASALITDREKWTHDHFGSRYFSELRGAGLRKPRDCCQLLRMYFKLAITLGGKSLWTFMQELEKDSHCMAACFNKLAPKDTALRNALGIEVKRGMCPFLSIDNLNQLLGYAGFFDPAVQEFLQSRALVLTSLGREDFFVLLRAVVKIISLKSVRSDQSPDAAIMDMASMCNQHPLTAVLIRRLCDVVALRSPKDFMPDATNGSSGFSIAILHACGRSLRVASEVIDHKLRAGQSEKLVENVAHVVDALLRSPPHTWEPSFNSLDTIIFFLEYMGKEDLNLAYEQLGKELEQAHQIAADQEEKERCMELIDLLENIMEIYTKPLVSLGVENMQEMQNMDIIKFIMESAPRLEHDFQWCGIIFTPADWADIVEIAATTAAAMQERFSVLMLPHHTQMIALLMFAFRACGAGSGNLNLKPLPQTMLARVGTGEGKSWIIGMLAAFVAKRGQRTKGGLRAHVVIDNNTLKSRDFDTVSKFFDKLGLKAGKNEEQLTDHSYSIVYCTGVEIWSQCRIHQEAGEVTEFEHGLRNAILIVDEVDGLIIDGDANIQYMYPDETLSFYADHWLRQLENDIEPEPTPVEGDTGISPDELAFTLQKVEEAYKQARKAEKGKDFEWRGNQMYMIDKSTGLLALGWWDLWYEIRYWIDTEWQGTITYKCIKSILCKKHCFTSYPCIFGLTGSLGQRAERQYLTTHYNAVSFNVPSFLDTCRNEDGEPQGKASVTRLNRTDIVQPDEDSQIRKVVNLAVQKCNSVPVLIIAKDQAVVETVARKIRRKLGEHKGGKEAEERVIRLLERPGEPQRFVKLVDAATQPWETDPATGENKSWRVTVTTAEGGRGHDYRVVDPAVDEKGGMLLILMWVSWSQREWVQFIGRTGRQDHAGQIAVYLNGQSQDILDMQTQGVDLSDGGKVIETILQAGDEKMKLKFDKVGTQISRGTLMHTLAAKYWKQTKTVQSTNPHQEITWRKLCREYLHSSRTEGSIAAEFEEVFPSTVAVFSDDESSLQDVEEPDGANFEQVAIINADEVEDPTGHHKYWRGKNMGHYLSILCPGTWAQPR